MLPDNATELMTVTPVAVELTKELVLIDTTPEPNTSLKSTTRPYEQHRFDLLYMSRPQAPSAELSTTCPLEICHRDNLPRTVYLLVVVLLVYCRHNIFKDRNINPMSLLEQIDIGILVATLARALPDRDGDIPMQ
ncbi:hypothetical protein N7491_010231 [Penicillium cf. griseofulvum]|uniref:Uncharacterized protein n=1 Tax=Penicillium cf. griseofulvum TaxID=2972120 RepID=A0A9W9T5M5_9EURO|nr:hypothetical protein N7472_000563 [Penicillium cf. griseofulvum]KAJ5421786.1 hypothetical protein N7491_010231 [Penicillium cf. griseofulvum]KAJ5427978.1 hypothetical protein N7445_009432 [Penicillium cf. griseofulvum]